ncbi:hypothetical protein DESPIG_02257 [Desulfovibrio piger ATCC 29098]|uniref:Uncharacterized protein n=1 Tax=Desulfovibrio piger ATCC 29098 TaxID=411464 RepID=B6WVY9_9BACT|nr:hypothetical protein DESPIG_02257 [Desulfovibrio piger ATCC 29098]
MPSPPCVPAEDGQKPGRPHRQRPTKGQGTSARPSDGQSSPHQA